MLETLTDSIAQYGTHPLGLLFSLVLGFVSAGASVCCTMPAIGLLIGYSGALSNDNRLAALKSTFAFTFGTVLSLMIIGGIAGFIGQSAQITLGSYWRPFAGALAVLISLAIMDLLPFKLSLSSFISMESWSGRYGIFLSGVVLGGMVVSSSLPCNPGIFIVVGAAVLQGKIVWSILLLTMFAIGFSVPLSAVILGISMSKASLTLKGADKVLRWISGGILFIAGFYFLVTF